MAQNYPENGSFVKKGTTLIVSEPFVAVLKSKLRNERCDECFQKCKLSKCTGCRYVNYCGKNCQRKSWKFHKVECSNMKRIHPLELPDAARFMCRLITKLRNGGDEERGYYSSSDYRDFGGLMSHYDDIKKDPRRVEHFTSLYVVLRGFLHETIMPSADELLEMFGRMIINSFHILDNELDSIGTGMYLGPSIINHSCKPSTTTIFDGTTLAIRTLRDIPSFDWSEVTITYIDVLQTTDERRAELEKSYYFRCNCERCLNPEAAAVCPNGNCKNSCSPDESKCDKCNENFPSNFQDDFRLMELRSSRCLKKLDEKKANGAGDIEKLEICRTCLKAQEGVLHPMNLLRVHVLSTASSAASSLELWQEAEIYIRELVKCDEYYYGDSHPMTGNIYLSLARVLNLLRKPKLAYDVGRKALDILKVAFGAKHSKITEVEMVVCCMRVECETTNR